MKNFKVLLLKIVSMISLLAGSNQAFGMLRRFASKTTLPTAAMLMPKRALCGNQAYDPMWIKVNHEIAQFEQKHGITTPAQLKVKMNLADISDELFLQCLNNTILDKDVQTKYLSKNSVDADGVSLTYTQEEKSLTPAIKQKIQDLLIKHNIDPKKIKIVFTQAIKHDDTDGAMGISGNYFIVAKSALNLTPAQMTAIIEHEIGHIISFDSAKGKINLKFKETNPELYDHYHKLIEKRADTHAAIQSVQNAEFIGIGYAYEFKDFDLINLLNKVSPKVSIRLKMKIDQAKSVGMNIENIKPRIFEWTKQCALDACTAHEITQQTCDEIVKFCDTPDYHESLKLYMKNKEAREPILPNVIHL